MLPKEFEQSKREHVRRLRASRVGIKGGLLGICMAGLMPSLTAGTHGGAVAPVQAQEPLATVRESSDEKEEEVRGGSEETRGGSDELKGGKETTV